MVRGLAAGHKREEMEDGDDMVIDQDVDTGEWTLSFVSLRVMVYIYITSNL